ncbi:TIGR03620 family F420-dependent LLM class oxidoreductase [Spirillospora sp. NPDC047279]|uniref:TIGR03620 family F420-dependent LLM class oxidoreductase n=1 Tax=Spirillospora sp. NPDC047279 TaxID=3155478 RepID=UPI0033EEF974
MANVVEEARRGLGRVGVWLMKARWGYVPAEVEREQIRRIEALGYGSVWGGETVGSKDAFVQHGVYLAATERLMAGTGIANAWSRHGATTQGAGAALAEAYPGRFVLGVGVGHPFQARSVGAAEWRPLGKMREYLDEMDAGVPAPPGAPKLSMLPDAPFPRVLAAIGPKMLGLARDRADGAQPFNITVEHTALAREILGPDKLLIPQHSVLLETDAVKARETLREGTRQGAAVRAYADNFRRLGYTEEDLTQASDRLIDATHAWGDEEAIARRIGEHLDAGADHVLVTPVADSLTAMVDELEKLTPALLGVRTARR